MGEEALRLAPPGAGVLVEIIRELAARVVVRSVLEDHETAILKLEGQVELLEKRVRDVETFAAVVDTMETRVQETQKVVAELGKKLEKSVRDLKKQWDELQVLARGAMG